MTRKYFQIISNIATEVGVTRTLVHLIVGYDKVAKKALIWPVICSCTLKKKIQIFLFVSYSTMTSDFYMKKCLEKRFLPFIKYYKGPVIFWPDLATCFYSDCAVEWYKTNKVDFINENCEFINPLNCPQLRPIERY